MDENRDKPFFVYLADHAVHAPFNPKPDLLAKYEAKKTAPADRRDDAAYAATIEAVDHNIGRLVAQIERLKLADETYIIFTSDNGGTDRYTAPLRGGKGELYEGGIRVPLLACGPRVQNEGSECAVPVASIDFYPTLLELADAPMPKSQTLDGVSLVPLLEGANALERERLFWHFPCYVGKATPASAVREGDYKLIEFFEDGGRQSLFDLRNDPNERHDLAQAMPEKAAALYRALQQWQTETKAAIPRNLNPGYDSKLSRPRRGR
jgi:arylsulfatase A-like enzyme